MTLDPTALVLLCGLLTALATGLGALPFAFVRTVGPTVGALTGAAASGLMLGASFGLLVEGAAYGTVQVVLGGGLGVAFILLVSRVVGDGGPAIGRLRGRGARRALLVLVAMTLHSFSEGVAVGVAFGGSAKLALLITLAIAVHNVPEGLAISAVLRREGASLPACAAWSVVSSLPQPLMAVPAFLFVERFQPVLPYGLGFAAGAMVFLVLLEVLPEAYEAGSKHRVGLWVAVTLLAMVLFQRLL